MNRISNLRYHPDVYLPVTLKIMEKMSDICYTNYILICFSVYGASKGRAVVPQ